MAHSIPRFHEAANIFPLMAAEAFEAFVNDVRSKGVLHPIVIWTDPRGREWLLDGRNRAKAWKRLADEGAQIDGKPIPLPQVPFQGTEEAALSYVIAANLHRRDLSSSQRAAVAIRANMLAARYHEKADPNNPQVIEGDIATQIAQMVGTNRTYVFRCQKILQHSPALLKRVVEGELSIPQALAIMKAEQQALNAADAGADAETAAEAAEAAALEEGAVLDGNKEPVPEEWANCFSTRDAYGEVVRALRAVKNQVEVLATGPGRHWLESEEVEAWINNTIRSLNAARPHALCPECLGDKLVEVPGKKRRQRCLRCEGRGYVNKARYQGAPSLNDAEPEAQAEQPQPDAKGKAPKAPKAKGRSDAQGEGETQPGGPQGGQGGEALAGPSQDVQDDVRERLDEAVASLPVDA